MTTVVVRRERFVPFPSDVVWQLLEPVEALPSWLPSVVRSEHLGGRGLGRRQRIVITRRGQRIEIDQEVTVYQPHRVLSWTQVAERQNGIESSGDGTATMTIRLEDAGPGTNVVLESRHTATGRAAGMRLRLVTARVVRASLDRALSTIASAGG